MVMTNSTIVEVDDVSESVVDGLIDELGKLPDFFTVELTLKVVVTPLPDAPKKPTCEPMHKRAYKRKDDA